jgi:hypothetical protein
MSGPATLNGETAPAWRRKMTWLTQRRLALGLVLLLSIVVVAPESSYAAPTASSDPVFGVATGSTDDEGDMTPTGNGKFTIDDRVYVGKSIGRSVDGLAAACFTGDLRSVEEWSLESSKMVGTHESIVTIKSEHGGLTLRLRGQMEQFTASGSWEIVKSSGSCAELDGDGKYTANYSAARNGPNLRLTFDGQTES